MKTVWNLLNLTLQNCRELRILKNFGIWFEWHIEFRIFSKISAYGLNDINVRYLVLILILWYFDICHTLSLS